ncbi:hypothetical protein D8M06_16765 [Oceanobacillus halophilus]|uniref:Uncharacterized protein n=1 Tax=Oceanobacillus halophilus TaxID=930130 RepID=A0A494ZW11_9BACI|nr:hypothetical protein D8M06_16765 [Oceanobacillus halophilus]
MVIFGYFLGEWGEFSILVRFGQRLVPFFSVTLVRWGTDPLIGFMRKNRNSAKKSQVLYNNTCDFYTFYLFQFKHLQPSLKEQKLVLSQFYFSITIVKGGGTAPFM